MKSGNCVRDEPSFSSFGFSKPGALHPVVKKNVFNDRGTSRPCLLPPMAIKSKPPAVLVIVDSIIRTIVSLSSRAGKLQHTKNKTAAHGDMSRRDEEDIEVCSRSIDLWGSLFIDCYNVACQAFFLFFFIFFIF